MEVTFTSANDCGIWGMIQMMMVTPKKMCRMMMYDKSPYLYANLGMICNPYTVKHGHKGVLDSQTHPAILTLAL